jgi:SAM-dependent methyltransferase
MSYSQGVAPYCDLFSGPEAVPDPAAAFLLAFVGEGSRVLDLGAGTGTTAIALAEHGVQVTALEPDAEMHGAMLTRLAGRPDLQSRITPVLGPAARVAGLPHDVCSCFSVMHLLDTREQDALLGHARASLRPGGKLVLDLPVASRGRQPRPWAVDAVKVLGELRIEHSSAVERSDAGWRTHWRFASWLHGRLIAAVDRTFDWEPLTHERTEELLRTSALKVEASFGGFDRQPYAPGESRTRLVVATAD